MNCKLTVALLLSALAVAAHAGVIVVAKDSPIANIDADEAKRIFMGHESQVAGQAVVVLYQTDSALRTEFETKTLGKTGVDLATYWSKMVFTGKAVAPVEVIGDGGVKSKIAGTPGAIGYISDGAADSSVKVVFKF